MALVGYERPSTYALTRFLCFLLATSYVASASGQPHPLSLENASNIRTYAESWQRAGSDDIKALVSSTTDVDATNEQGNTLLIYALEYGSLELVQELIEVGADPTIRNAEGEFPLLIAALYAQPETLDLLLGTEAADDVNAAVPGSLYTPLLQASLLGMVEKVEALLDAGADVSHKNVFGATALMNAAGTNPDPRVLSKLLEAGADPNATSLSGVTPLMNAAALGSSVVKLDLLLAAGANPHLKDNRGLTALDHAKNNSSFSKEELVQLAETLGGEASLKFSATYRTAL